MAGCPIKAFCGGSLEGGSFCKTEAYQACPTWKDKELRVHLYANSIRDVIKDLKTLLNRVDPDELYRILCRIGVRNEVNEDWLRRKAFNMRMVYASVRKLLKLTGFVER